MTRILITGSQGFLGRNLAAHLHQRKDCEVSVFTRQHSGDYLEKVLLDADVIFHLAGVNRPQNPDEFEQSNTVLTEQICRFLQKQGRSPRIIFSSSSQAAFENPYGVSKARAEMALKRFAAETGATVRIYRLKNLFGKWCRPNYNSVTATFCHNIARDLPINISDPTREMELSHVDDVVAAFSSEIGGPDCVPESPAEIPTTRIQLRDLAGRLQAFHELRSTLTLPDFSDSFNRALYGTYLSYVPADARGYDLDIKADSRGSLAEFIKQKSFGQIFVSRTKPGITRGNHYHHTKAEKFFVVEGEGLIRMRAVEGGQIDEYRVAGTDYRVIDIPPGFTHSITNVGASEMVTIFWSSELFDPDRPDTQYLPVDSKIQMNSIQLENA